MFPFCPKCTAKLEKKSDLLDVCTSCNFRFYHNPIPAATLLLTDNLDRILMTLRAEDPFKNTWDLPGGFVEQHETGEEALQRECQEELSIKLTEIKYFRSHVDTYHQQNTDFPVLNLVYTAKTTSKTFEANDDISETHFFPPTDIPWANIGFTSIKQTLKEFIERYS